MTAVVVPARAGVLSAVGLLAAPIVRELVVAWPHGTDVEGLEDFAATLLAAAEAEVAAMRVDGGPIETTVAYDCRYLGQGHELRVRHPDDFGAEHRRRNGDERPDHPVEVVAVARPAPSSDGRARRSPNSRRRSTYPGPAPRSSPPTTPTTWVPPGWVARPGAKGSIVIERVPA